MNAYTNTIIFTLIPLFVSIYILYFIYTYKIRNFANRKKSSESLTPLNSGGRVPKHIAVIMDGNRRFGREKLGDPLQVRE